MEAIATLIRGSVALVAFAILAGTIVLNPLVTGWVGGFVTHKQIQSQGLIEAREDTYKVICGDYFNSSIFERWTSVRHFGNGWCDDYKHRL